MVTRFTRFLLLAWLLPLSALTGWQLSGHTPLWLAITSIVVTVILLRGMNFPGLLLITLSSMDSPTTRLSPFGILRYMAGEIWSAALSTNWHMPFCRVRQHVFPERKDIAPVLLIHGYLCNSGVWARFSRKLRQQGITHYAVDLEPVFGNIEDYVPAIAAAIARIRQETGQPQVTIIGHSMGGLVARAYLRQHGTTHVRQVITLGSPHHGTRLSGLGYGANARQMAYQQPEEGWLPQLARSEAATTRMLITSIYSRHDNIVMPSSTSLLEGADNLVVTGIGHVALCYSSHIHDIVLTTIHNRNTTT